MQLLFLLAQVILLTHGDYTSDGVFISISTNFLEEIAKIRTLLKLKPGMTYCEMGAGDGEFMVPLGKSVMPGGKVIVTEVGAAELLALRTASFLNGLDASVVQATDTKMGLPVGFCDVIMSRMVYHMIPEGVALGYLPQLKQALKHGGKILILDHDPDNCAATTRANATLGRMKVVPRLQEIREYTSAGFALHQMLEWPWFGPDEHGFGLLWMDAEVSSQEQQFVF